MRFLAVLLLLAATLSPGRAGAQGGATDADVGASPRSSLAGALVVLHSWDARRAEAWASQDEDTLRSLYTSGAAAERADVSLLRHYSARRLVVRRLVTQVFAARVLRAGESEIRLLVSDRVAGGVVMSGRRSTALPSSRPVTRIVTLRRLDRDWQVAAVSGSGRVLRATRH